MSGAGSSFYRQPFGELVRQHDLLLLRHVLQRCHDLQQMGPTRNTQTLHSTLGLDSRGYAAGRAGLLRYIYITRKICWNKVRTCPLRRGWHMRRDERRHARHIGARFRVTTASDIGGHGWAWCGGTCSIEGAGTLTARQRLRTGSITRHELHSDKSTRGFGTKRAHVVA